MNDIINAISFTVEYPDDKEVTETIIHLLMDDWKKDGIPVLQPATVYTTCPYAPYVEFGTGKAKKKIDPTKSGGKTLDEIILEWAQKKVYPNEPAKAAAFAKNLVKHIRQSGINPQPYFRGAVYSVLDEYCDNSDRYLGQEGGSFKDLCELIVERIRENLENNGTNYEGKLTQSFKSETIDQNYDVDYTTGEVSLAGEPPERDDEDSELWKDPKKGINNKRAVYHNRS